MERKGYVELSKLFHEKMGRKPKIIPHIPGTLEQIADAMFAKDKNTRKKKQKKKSHSDKQQSN